MQTTFTTIDAYIDAAPEAVQPLLRQVRATIRSAAPGAAESISYGMPTFKVNGKPLVYFAAFKNHIGFYATPTGHEAFAADLAPYKQGKGSVQFPLSQPIPFDLIARITRFRGEADAVKTKKNPTTRTPKAEDIDALLNGITHPLKPVVLALHRLILAADPEIGAQVKWNAPAYYFTGPMKAFDAKEYKRDIVVMNLRRPNEVLLVFPTGATIADHTGLLGGDFKDTRKTAVFTSMDAVTAQGGNLQQVLRTWLAQVER